MATANDQQEPNNWLLWVVVGLFFLSLCAGGIQCEHKVEIRHGPASEENRK